MKAVRFHTYGGPEVLRLDEAPDPTPGPDDVLIDVTAAGINPLDWKIRSGALAKIMPMPLPFVLGWDVAGTVASVGEHVSSLEVGDAVFGMIPIGAPGAYAEMALAPASVLATLPGELTPLQAAVIPVVGLAAYQLVNAMGGFRSGQSVLVLGAAGNVGRLCVALALNLGAHVIAAAKASDLENADWPSDVELRAFDEGGAIRSVQPVDLLIDTVGGQLLADATAFVRPGGRVISTVQPPQVPAGENVEAQMLQVAPDRVALEELAKLFADGALQTPAVTSLGLSEASRAHEVGEAGRTGKLALITG